MAGRAARARGRPIGQRRAEAAVQELEVMLEDAGLQSRLGGDHDYDAASLYRSYM